MFKHLKVGDRVMRDLAGQPMLMQVVDVQDELLYCAAVHPDGSITQFEPWPFDREHGWEHDEEMQWGHKFGVWHLVPDERREVSITLWTFSVRDLNAVPVDLHLFVALVDAVLPQCRRVVTA